MKNYKEWNDEIRKIVNEETKVVSALKLPNTVMLQFRKDDSKQLSINTFDKLVTGLGLSWEIEIKDSEGNLVDADTIASIVKERFGGVKKDTLAAIAGVSKAPKNKEAEMPEIELPAAASAGQEEAAVKEDAKASETESKSTEGKEASEELATSPEIDIDLSNVFG